MVERYLINYDERGEVAHPSGDFVHYSDYARLQEQVETLTRERDQLQKIADSKVVSYRDLNTVRAEAAEAERELLGQAKTALGPRKFPKLWLRIGAALQKEHQP